MSTKSLIYDGGCILCIRSKNTLLALGLADKGYTWAYQEMEDEYVAQVDYERFRNEMALIDLEGGPTLYGPTAISYLLSAKSIVFRFIFSIGPLFQLFSFCYKIIAQNRTAILAPNAKKIRCASCEPVSSPTYRWYWIVFSLGIGLIATLLSGSFPWRNLNEWPFSIGFLSLLLGYYLLLDRNTENPLELAAHSASFLMLAMVLSSVGFYLMDVFGSQHHLSIWMLLFAGILFLLGKNFIARARFLALSPEATSLGACCLALLLLIYYSALIF